MAKSKNILLNGMSGTIGKQLVIKQYSHATVVTGYPDMSGVKPSKLQKHNRGRFAEAVQYAKSVLQDAKKKSEYQKKIGKGKSVYREAIKEYMMIAKP